MPVLWRDRQGGAVGAYHGPPATAEPAPRPPVPFWWPMRGRWWHALAAALIGALLLGLIGWWTSTVRYAATGRVETQPYQTGSDDRRPDAALLAGVVEREAEQLRELLGKHAPRAFGEIVATPPSGVTLTVVTSSPAAAKAAVEDTLASYKTQSALLSEVELARQVGQQLTDLDALRAARDEIQQRIDVLAWNEDDVALPAALESAQREVSRAEARHAQLRNWQERTLALKVSRETGLTVLAENDPEVSAMLVERAELLIDLLSALQDENKEAGPELRRRWSAVQARLDEIAADTRVMPSAWVGAPHDEQRLVAVRLSQLDAQIAGAAAEADEARATAAVLEERHEQVRELRSRWRDAQRQVQNAEQALAALTDRPAAVLKLDTEKTRLASTEQEIAAPVFDNRPERITAFALPGALVGFLGVAAFAFLDRRCRRPDPEPWTVRDAPLVGVVPEVNTGTPGDPDPTPDQAAAIQRDLSRLADSVHAIRAVIEAQIRADTAKTICITSAQPHSGKTSLTVGLASSLVMGGMKVLVVDADLTGRTTRNASATEHAGPEPFSQTLDDVLIAMGYLEAEDRELLSFPDDEVPVGLGAYMRGAPLEACVIRTRIPGLALLSGAQVKPGDAGRISRPFMQQLADEANTDFDVVLFDTGSIPRCVEALFVAGACHGALIVVGQGENRRPVDHALERLRLVGAHVLGTVFNRDTTPADPKTHADTGGTIDPSWRDQGSGMFAAAVRTHGGQDEVYTPPRGQTGMYRGKRTAKEAAASAASAAGPIDFGAGSKPKPPANPTPDQTDDPALADADDSWAGHELAEPDLRADANPESDPLADTGELPDARADGLIDQYIDSVLDAAGKPDPHRPDPKKTPAPSTSATDAASDD